MSGMSALYVSKWVHLIAILLVVVGGINWGLVGSINFDLVQWLGASVGLPVLSKIIYITVGVAALYLAFDRDTYLPFLGETVYPCTGLADKVPDEATVSVSVKVPAGSKVVYWASEHSKDMDIAPNPWVAYMNYENSGVVTANADGLALLKVREPIGYKVPSGRTLQKHIHYRYCRIPGILSRVETVFV
jgi:uncharacterized membrane protein YuzA (DUF378 family)